MKSFWKKAGTAALIIGLAAAAFISLSKPNIKPEGINAEAPYSIISQEALIPNDDDDFEDDERKKNSVQRSFLRVAAVFFTSLFSFVISALIKPALVLLAPLLKFISGPLGLLYNILADALAIFVLIMLMAGVIFKLLYPDKSLRELYTKKNILITALSSFVLSSALNILNIIAGRRLIILKALVSAVVSFLVLGFTAYKIIGSDSRIIKRTLGEKRGKIIFAVVSVYIVACAALKVFLSNLSSFGLYLNIFIVFTMIIAIFLLIAWFKMKKNKPIDCMVKE